MKVNFHSPRLALFLSPNKTRALHFILPNTEVGSPAILTLARGVFERKCVLCSWGKKCQGDRVEFVEVKRSAAGEKDDGKGKKGAKKSAKSAKGGAKKSKKSKKKR